MRRRTGQTLVALASAALLAMAGATGCGEGSTAAPDRQRWGTIQRAVDDGDAERVAALLRSAPDLVRVDDGDGHTPLHVAADAGRAGVARELLRRGADLEARDSCGWTPLHAATSNGRLTTVRVLIEAGADVNALDQQGQTPLSLARKRDHRVVASLLREHGAHE